MVGTETLWLTEPKILNSLTLSRKLADPRFRTKKVVTLLSSVVSGSCQHIVFLPGASLFFSFFFFLEPLFKNGPSSEKSVQHDEETLPHPPQHHVVGKRDRVVPDYFHSWERIAQGKAGR